MDVVVQKATCLCLMALGVIQFCSCQCVDTRHLDFQSKEKYSIRAGHAFKILSNTDLWLCMELCYRYTLCRSVDWDRDKSTCRLNVRSATEDPSLLVTKQRNVHVDREHFPKVVAGDCSHHSCDNVSICIRGHCVPTLEGKTCGSPPAVPHTDRGPPPGPFPVGHTHNYTSCSVGYLPSGDPYTTCQDEERWSDVIFKCKAEDQYIASGYIQAGNWTYYFENVKMNAIRAQEFCTSKGMDLIRIETLLEWQTLQPHLVGRYWTDGYVYVKTSLYKPYYKKTVFVWKSSTQEIEFFSWIPGQPDDPINRPIITVNATGWSNEKMDAEIYALCEDHVA